MKTEYPDKVYTVNNSKVGANNKRQLVKFGRTINDSYMSIFLHSCLFTRIDQNFCLKQVNLNFLHTQVTKKLT